MWWCLAGFLLLIQNLLSSYTVKLTLLYTKISKKHVPNLRTAINQPAVLMQDNAPCNTAKLVKTFLSKGDVTVMEWPTQSPDMNPIENVWKLLNKRPKEKNPRNVEELWTRLKGEWKKISVDECKTLIHSCSKRFQATHQVLRNYECYIHLDITSRHRHWPPCQCTQNGIYAL